MQRYRNRTLALQATTTRMCFINLYSSTKRKGPDHFHPPTESLGVIPLQEATKAMTGKILQEATMMLATM